MIFRISLDNILFSPYTVIMITIYSNLNLICGEAKMFNIVGLPEALVAVFCIMFAADALIYIFKNDRRF